MLFRFTILFLLLLLSLPAYAAKHALLIGISDYGGSGFLNLDGTINDVELVRDVLKDHFGYKDSDIRILTNNEATHNGIKQAFTRLAGKVGKDDIVYIHFSGHGSLTRNLNGQKKPKFAGGTAYDSTWVSYGSRTKVEGADLNGYDILNEEVGEWLLPIYAKTNNIAFVSDSCHSGNMTRGEAPKVRAVAVDMRPHPLGTHTFKHSPEIGVIVGAAQQDQQAGEFQAPNGKSYGLFTWNWVQALAQTSPGETWDEVFKRSVALIGTVRETQQHPLIEGKKNRSAFGGDFPKPEQSIPISDVSEDGKLVTIKGGRFVGITVGSVYRKKGSDDTFAITTVQTFTSTGEVSKGSFKKGDLAVEETHVYPYEPLKVFVRADLPIDAPLADSVRGEISKIPGYAKTASQKEADLLVLVIRPKQEGGKPFKERPEATLPMADPSVKPEIWILGSDERPIREKIPAMRPDSDKRAVELVAENLKKLSRIMELKRLGGTGNNGASLVDVLVSRYAPDPKCSGEKPICLDVPDVGKFRMMETFPARQMQDQKIERGNILTFKVKNNAFSDLYCYLIDITANGKVSAIFPGPQDSSDSVLVAAGKERDFLEASGIMIEEPGEDTVKLIVSQMPLDVTLFEQTAYKTRGQTKCAENPLENFLSSAMGGQTRGAILTSPKRSQWGTVQFSFEGK